ncbi:hypothetical protein QIS99_30335 [Streptomyces sp. B-S-A8]|uniref:DUF2795 domain-containing protein n=1 Tax=Streptomyces solicavernae TaxID=3043614 RepID=A0ABT6S1Y0_9ACTN|nr:hypothetical protein [Streptomyces sp. B-S-A8]MDI3390459.1 hypothetical protein [Streptomyces sp. B-S-A8]
MPRPIDAAELLVEYGHNHGDSPTTADLIAAAELSGLGFPDRDEQDAIRAALDNLTR